MSRPKTIFSPHFLTVLLSSALLLSTQSFTLAKSKSEAAAEKQFVTAASLFKAGDADKAVEEIDAGLKLMPRADLYGLKAECLLELHKPLEAINASQSAIKLDPENPALHLDLGAAYYAAGKNSEAMKEFDYAVQKCPTERAFRSWREKLFERNHDYARAVIDLTVLIEHTEIQNRAKPFQRRANCYMYMKDYPHAIADYSQAIKLSTGRTDLFRQRADAYEKSGNHAAAQKDLVSASEIEKEL